MVEILIQEWSKRLLMLQKVFSPTEAASINFWSKASLLYLKKLHPRVRDKRIKTALYKAAQIINNILPGEIAINAFCGNISPVLGFIDCWEKQRLIINIDFLQDIQNFNNNLLEAKGFQKCEKNNVIWFHKGNTWITNPVMDLQKYFCSSIVQKPFFSYDETTLISLDGFSNLRFKPDPIKSVNALLKRMLTFKQCHSTWLTLGPNGIGLKTKWDFYWRIIKEKHRIPISECEVSVWQNNPERNELVVEEKVFNLSNNQHKGFCPFVEEILAKNSAISTGIAFFLTFKSSEDTDTISYSSMFSSPVFIQNLLNMVISKNEISFKIDGNPTTREYPEITHSSKKFSKNFILFTKRVQTS